MSGSYRLATRLPLDRAAEAGAVRLGHRGTGQHQLDRGGEQLAGYRLAVARSGPVERPPVGKPQVGVVEEEVGRAGRPVRGRDVLVGVEQVRKLESGPLRLLPQPL